MYTSFKSGSFHLIRDTAILEHMLKVMSLKLSVKARQRLAWMDLFRECGNAAQVCRHFSIPLRTFWRWKKRFDPWDLKSLEDRSHRPKHSPRRISWETEKAILALKQAHPRWGMAKIAFKLRSQSVKVSPMTCWRVCKRHSLIVRYKTRKRKAPKPRVNLASIKLPGDLFQMDTKHVNLHGRKVYQYTIIDVVSKKRHADIYWHADMVTTIKFLEAALKEIPWKPRMIQTDNGSEFGRSVSIFLRKQSIRHVFSHKSRPVENCYVERSHRIDEEEFYSVGPIGTTFQELRERFAAYLNMYNNERPHWGLKGLTPAQFIANYSLTKPCHMS